MDKFLEKEYQGRLASAEALHKISHDFAIVELGKLFRVLAEKEEKILELEKQLKEKTKK